MNLNVFIQKNYEFSKIKHKYRGILGKIKAYFDISYAEQIEEENSSEYYSDPPVVLGSDPILQPSKEYLLKLAIECSFGTSLTKIIEEKGKTPVEVYTKANIDRKLFSKIYSNHQYVPSKKTIIALALGLELSLKETQDLLSKAGFTLSKSILFDLIIEYFILQGKYNIFEINEALLTHKQKTL